ncbi:MAG: pyridoxal-phosphate dependent enzyme [Pseudomonadota bacterium]
MSSSTPTGYNYLAERYPLLGRRLDRVPIGCFPTPLDPLEDGLWIKRDNATDTLYGGNKVRKLEYLLGRARARGASDVLTFGGVGSNHALATSLHARSLDLGAHAMLMPQLATDFIDATLARHEHNGTALQPWPRRRPDRVAALRELREKSVGGLAVVPLGGTSAIGSIGYVNAAFELARQWSASRPPPGRIYVAAGTMGTAAGLAVGLALLKWPTEVVGVRVTAPSQVNDPALQRLCHKIVQRLHHAWHGISLETADQVSVTLRHDYLGKDYADPTAASHDAVAYARTHWRLPLETTYTGKAMACLLDDMPGKPASEDWVYWHTYAGSPLRGNMALAPQGNYARFRELLYA